MNKRAYGAKPKMCIASAFVVWAAAPLLQLAATAPAAAAPRSIGVFAWGDNSTGELGNGVAGGYNATPAAVGLPLGVTPIAIAAGGGAGGIDMESPQNAAYAIGSDGKLYAWGDNSLGALGDGSTTPSASPVVVSLPSGVTATAISAAQGTGYAIGSDGKLYAWGDNNVGRLGNGSAASDSLTPVVVSLPSGVTPTAIAGGYGSAYAMGSDGKLYAWGDNFYGELGDGGNTNSSVPVLVSLPSGVTPKQIAAGGGTGYAIGSDGKLYGWGYNVNGGLGNNSTTNSSLPVVVQFPTGVTAKAVTGGGGFAHAIGSDGNLYGWGLGSTANQLGTGSSDSSVPIEVSLASGVTPTAISDNIHSGYAIGSNGKLYAWGYGLAGELGNGSTGNFSPPVVVSLPPGSTPLSLGAEPGAVSGFAIVNAPPTAPVVTTNPTDQTALPTQSVTFSAAASGYPAPTVQWRVSTDGGLTYAQVSGATSDSLTVPSVTLSENGYKYEAVFTNGSGTATTNPATLSVTAPPPPTTNVNIPSNGTTVSGDIWLGASAQSVVGIKSVSFEVTGGSVSNFVVSSSGDTAWGWLGAWDTTDVANGTYTLQSVATDNNGNSSPSLGVTVTVDNLPLHTQVLVPSNGATLTGKGAVLDASAAGTSDVTGVQFVVTGGSLSDHVVGTAVRTLYGWIALWDTTTVPNGSYTLQSKATETGGTTAMSPGITVTVSNTYAFNQPQAIASDGSNVWVVNSVGNTVTQMKASDGSWVKNLSGGSYGFNGISGIAFGGTHLWVANNSGNSVTEMNASTGSWVQTLSGGSYGFNGPHVMAFDGSHMWVGNQSGNSVTELNASDGSWVRTLSGGSYGFNNIYAVTFDGSHLWVANAGGNSVTELNASDGSWVQTLSGGSYGFAVPAAIAFDGTHLWVANAQGPSVTEISPSDGSWVRTVSGGSYGFGNPNAIVFANNHLWAPNYTKPSVTELNATDGSWVQTLTGGSYGFGGPIDIAFDGTHLWVTNLIANSVTELNASDGSWVRTLSN